MLHHLKNVPISHHHLRVGWRFFWRQVRVLVSNPIFIILTLIGNGLMLLGAFGFYFLESAPSGGVADFLSALRWAVSTVTTVGYGDITPTSAGGKILDIVLMIAGAAIYTAFTGIFASTLLMPSVEELESEIKNLRQGIKGRDK